MMGKVDDQSRALVPIRIGQGDNENRKEVLAWVDTAFNGTLVIPKSQIDELELPVESSAEAVLADGTIVQLETFGCSVEWFGKTYDTQVVPNDGVFALLGTMLLANRRLEIDYAAMTVKIE